jgi:hypothetical protein
MAKNVFAADINRVYPFRFKGEIQIERLMGGTPSDPKVAEGWLKSKMGLDKEDIIAQAVAEVMAARNVTEDEALKEVDKRRHLNGFKRDTQDGLYIEGRHLKAALKEAASVARAVDNLPSRYGATKKGTLSFIAEHIVVLEDRLYVGQRNEDTKKVDAVREPTGVLQSFPRNPITRQTGIQYTEYIDDAVVGFTVISDYDFTKNEWATIWVTGGQQGIGASRSQGYGRYVVTHWEMIGEGKKAKAVEAA